MINYRYLLIKPKLFEKILFNENVNNKIIIKPTMMSICAADQRYFLGLRNPEILKEKLPMALIHEGVGIVTYSENSEFKKGEKVVLLPNIYLENNRYENYSPDSKFMSSNCDGFMQEFIFTTDKQLLKYNNIDDEYAVFTELLSVAVHAVQSHINNIEKSKNIVISGDGNLAYLIHLYLHSVFPNIHLTILGINDEKLNLFTYANKKINIIRENINESPDIIFEAIGGSANSEKIIANAIDCILPTGVIYLLGVSENPVNINTRKILEKGLTLIGISRSTLNDFKIAINFLSIKQNQIDISKIISDIVIINGIDDMIIAFENDQINKFKTLMKWKI